MKLIIIQIQLFDVIIKSMRTETTFFSVVAHISTGRKFLGIKTQVCTSVPSLLPLRGATFVNAEYARRIN